MSGKNLGSLYYTVGMKGIADAKKQLAELDAAIKKGAISGPAPTAADFSQRDAVGEAFAKSIAEKTKNIQSSLEKALKAGDQKTAARVNAELRKLEGIDPTKGSSALFFAKTEGYSADFVNKLERAIAETARKAFEGAAKQLEHELAQRSARENAFGAGIKLPPPGKGLSGGGVTRQAFGDPGAYVKQGSRYGYLPDSGPFGQYVRPPRSAEQLAGGLPHRQPGLVFGTMAPSGVPHVKPVRLQARDTDDTFNAGLSVERKRLEGLSLAESGLIFGEGLGDVRRDPRTGRFLSKRMPVAESKTVLPYGGVGRKRIASEDAGFTEGMDDFAAGLLDNSAREVSAAVGKGVRKAARKAIASDEFGTGVFDDVPDDGDEFGAGIIKRRLFTPRPKRTQPESAPLYGPEVPAYYRIPGGPSYQGDGGNSKSRLNPWLVNVDSTRRRVGHQALTERASRASDVAGEIGNQVFNRNINEELSNARRSVLREYQSPGSTGRDLTTRQNELVDIQAKTVHLADQRADIERRVDGILGTQVSHLDKIRASEEAALNYARQRAGRDLTAQETSDISRDVRERERRQLVGGDAANTSSRLQEVQESIYSIQSSGSTSTPDVQHQMERRVRMLKEEAVLLVRRQELLERQAMLENALASGVLPRGQRFLTQSELTAVNEELKKNASATENSQRHQAGNASRKYNYRLQELSYGVQDFTQVLAGGGGLDGALRAANNNISQFYAAAGGANAARNSMVATFAILGIAAALKYMGDMAELPAKRLEEVNERLKTTQSLSKDLGRLFEVGSTRVGDISGEPAIAGARAQSESERDARLQRQQINNEAEIFGIKQKPSFGEGVGRNVRINTGTALAAIGGITSLGGLVQNPISDHFNRGAGEFHDTGSKSDLGKVFKERFVDRKPSSKIENSSETFDPVLITPRTRKYFDAILKSADTSPETAVKAFKEIDEGGGWSDVPDEEMKPFRDSIQKLEEQLKRIRVAAVVFESALASMSKNIASRNQLLSGASLQRRTVSNSEDVSFINEQNELASQLEANARANREEGLVTEAEKAEKDAAARRRLARTRLQGMNPGGELLTTQALSFEERLAGFDKQIAEAKRMRDESGSGAGWIRGNQQMRDVRLAKENFLMEDPKSFSFEAQRSNESFAEADDRMSKTYQQMTDSINKNSQKSAAAADAARDKLGQAKARQDSLNAASRTHDSADRMARAYGTRFDEQDAAVDLDHIKRVEKIKQDYSDKGSAARLQQELAAEKAAYDRRKSELQKERSDYYKFSEESRFAEAYGTSYDERQAAFERENASREDEINRNYAKPGQQVERQRQLDIERDRQVRRKSDMDRLEKRDRDDLRNMFAGDAASLIGGREGQHYANAKQLEDRLRQIEDADKAGMFKGDPMEKQRLLDQAETVFNERQKDISRKQVGFSDIGGMWKQIQMSLKPDKSIALATTANAHLSSISKHSSDAGLKVVISLSP